MSETAMVIFFGISLCIIGVGLLIYYGLGWGRKITLFYLHLLPPTKTSKTQRILLLYSAIILIFGGIFIVFFLR